VLFNQEELNSMAETLKLIIADELWIALNAMAAARGMSIVTFVAQHLDVEAANYRAQKKEPSPLLFAAEDDDCEIEGLSRRQKLSTERIRLIVELFELKNMKPREIAQRMGVSDPAIYRILAQNSSVYRDSRKAVGRIQRALRSGQRTHGPHLGGGFSTKGDDECRTIRSLTDISRRSKSFSIASITES
jgi:DNA-directed RNA polymerase specialized sigma subunit